MSTVCSRHLPRIKRNHGDMKTLQKDWKSTITANHRTKKMHRVFSPRHGFGSVKVLMDRLLHNSVGAVALITGAHQEYSRRAKGDRGTVQQTSFVVRLLLGQF